MKISSKILKIVSLILFIAAIVFAFLNKELFVKENIEQFLSNLGPLAPLYFFLIFAFVTVLFIPVTPFIILGSVFFGYVWGTIIVMAATILASGVSFLIARYLLKEYFEKKASGLLDKLNQGLDEKGSLFIAITRMTPIFPFQLQNYAYGLTRVSFMKYILVSAIFMLPGTLAFIFLGEKILEIKLF